MKLNFKKFTLYITSIIYLSLLLTTPLLLPKISYFSEIFPAIELIVIYCLCTITNIKYWQLFIIGFIIDQLQNMPIGSNSLAFMLGNFIILIFSRWLLIREYFINLAIFCLYSLFIIFLRFLIITITNSYSFGSVSILFYFLTTILIYPSMKILVEAPLIKIKRYA